MEIDAPTTPSTAIVPVILPADSNNEAPPSEEQSNKRRRKKSIVWEHFTIEPVGAGCMRACCKQCKKSFAYITGSKLAGTSHLKRHIALGICPVSRQRNEAAGLMSGSKSEPPKKRQRASPGFPGIPFDQDRCNHEIAKMIIQHEYPLHMVEHPAFIDFVRTLHPQYNVVSFNTIQGECVGIYLREKQNLLNLISQIPGRVSLSLDLGTSNQNIGYTFLTGHFVDADWNLHRKILNVVMIPFPDSDYAFNQAVVSCLTDWNLESKLFTLAADQSFSNETALGNLRGLLSVRNPFMLNGQLLNGNCYARVLSRLAQDALGAVRDSVGRIRESVKYVKTSEAHDEKFSELRQQLQVPSSRDLIMDDRTKWNTTYHMLVAACELKEVFACLDTSDHVYKINPSVDDWKQVEILCTYLKLLFDAANLLTGPTCPPANLFYHEVSKIQLELTHAAMSLDPFVSNLTKPLKEKFNKYWKECFLVLAVAVVMDPRFKMKLVEFSFSKIFGEDAGMWIKIVDDSIHELFEEYIAPYLHIQAAFVEGRDVTNPPPETLYDAPSEEVPSQEVHHQVEHSQELSEQETFQDMHNHEATTQEVHHQELCYQEVPPEEAPQEMHTPEAPSEETPHEGENNEAAVGQQMDTSSHPQDVDTKETLPQEMDTQYVPPQGTQEAPSRESDAQEEAIQEAQEVPSQEMDGQKEASQEMHEAFSQEMDVQKEATQEVNAQEASSQEMHTQQAASQEKNAPEAASEEADTEEMPREETDAEEAASQEMHMQEAPPQEIDAHEAASQDMQTQEVPPLEMQTQEVPPLEMQTQELPPQEMNSQEATSLEIHMQEVPPLEMQTQEVPPLEMQTQEVPPQEMNSQEATSLEIHMQEAVPEEMHFQEASVQDMHSQEASVQDMHSQEAPSQEMHTPEFLPQVMHRQEHPQEMHTQELSTGEMHTEEPPEFLPQVMHRQEHPQEMHTQELSTGEMHTEEPPLQEMQTRVLSQEIKHEEMHTQDLPLLSIGDGLSDFDVYISEITSGQHLKSELDQYLEESLLPRVQEFDVLGWWKLNKLKYPTLSKMAADILSIPMSTVAPESVFDTENKKIDSYRSSLRSVTLEALICAKDWLQHTSTLSSSFQISNALVKMEY